MYAEGLLAQGIDLEKKKREVTALLVEQHIEYGNLLSEIELRKAEGKSNNLIL